MFSTEAKALKGAIVTAALLGLGGTALAQSTVVRVGGPSARSYPVGKSLPATAKITLVTGDTLTVLDGKGTRTLRGPGTYNASGLAAAPDKRGTFTQLVTTQNRTQSRTGAVRGPDGQVIARAPNLWLVDVRQSSSICLTDTNRVNLWRPDMQKADTLTVTDDASGKTATLKWAMGRSEISWPAAVPATSGASYTLSWSGAAQPAKIRIVKFDPAAASDPAELSAALHARGCSAQFDLLAASM